MIDPNHILILAALIILVQVMIALFASFESGFTNSMTYAVLWIVYLQLVGLYRKLSPELLDNYTVFPVAFITFFTILGIAVYIRVLRLRSS